MNVHLAGDALLHTNLLHSTFCNSPCIFRYIFFMEKVDEIIRFSPSYLLIVHLRLNYLSYHLRHLLWMYIPCYSKNPIIHMHQLNPYFVLFLLKHHNNIQTPSLFNLAISRKFKTSQLLAYTKLSKKSMLP